MRLKPQTIALATALVVAIGFDPAAAQVAPSAPSAPTAPAAPEGTSGSQASGSRTLNGGGGRRGGGRGTTVGVGVNLGGGSFGGGGGLGFGLGAAGAALGLGIIGTMGRTPTYSGENSTPLETRVRSSGSDESQPPSRAHRLRTRLPPLDNPSGLSESPPPPRPGFAVPAKTETRFVPGEVLLVVKAGTKPTRLKRLETSLGLTPLASVRIGLLEAEVRRYGLRPGLSVAAAVTALRGRAIVLAAQPNYLYELQEDAGAPVAKLDTPPRILKPAAVPAGAPPGPPQYAVGFLHLLEAHRLATGADIRVAVIDSGVDETNPDLKDSIVDRFDAVGGSFQPHSHGTAIGGAIVAHHTLVGVAPKARLIAIRAFMGSARGAAGTGFNILRGLDFAAFHGARIVNMSFAGPKDLLLEDALQAARKRGIIAVAAAGNGGPLAKPLYPAAGQGIIAVTATDATGKPFAQANRGAYVAVAAPGVDIIAPGLGNSVQMTSGTSIATAEASGVVALLLERRPSATPDEIRQILRVTARKLAVEPGAAGAGLIDAAAAVSSAK